MRKALTLGTLVLAVAGSAFAAAPASAADTTVTFTAGTSGTTVSILPSAAVVGVTVGNTVTGVMTATITDLRVAGGSWATSISSTDFALVGAASQTGASLVPATSAKVWNTAVTVAVPGTATVTNSFAALSSARTLSNTAQPLVSATTTNVNTTVLAQSLQIDVTGKNTGAYTGTITQTVS